MLANELDVSTLSGKSLLSHVANERGRCVCNKKHLSPTRGRKDERTDAWIDGLVNERLDSQIHR